VIVESRAAGRWDEADLAVVATVARQTALALRTSAALSNARAELRRMSTGARGVEAPEILGESPVIVRLVELVDRAAPTDATVLVLGPTGTGKELVARRLHARSARRTGPFVALSCAAIVDGLVESELFGHEKGAFTGADARKEGRIAQAGGGTLFLDEVGELSASLQAKLLRVLSDRTYTRVGGRDALRMECRLVAATHRDLPTMVREGRFREDLWYRLAVVTVETPPLAARGDDVIRLAEVFLERIAARLARRTPTLSADARARLLAHRWPGNVRELENALERAVVLTAGAVLTAADLPRDLVASPSSSATGPAPATEVITVAEAEKRAILAALAHTKGKKGEAAALLGISWPTLNRKLHDYGP
jgi:two-component system response regulator HydG